MTRRHHEIGDPVAVLGVASILVPAIRYGLVPAIERVLRGPVKETRS